MSRRQIFVKLAEPNTHPLDGFPEIDLTLGTWEAIVGRFPKSEPYPVEVVTPLSAPPNIRGERIDFSILHSKSIPELKKMISDNRAILPSSISGKDNIIAWMRANYEQLS